MTEPQYRIIVTTARHIDQLLRQELQPLGLHHVRQTGLGIEGTATLATIYRICLWSRLANRVLLPVLRCQVTDAQQLYHQVRQVEWFRYFHCEQTFAIHVKSAQSTLTHSHATALKIKDAIVDDYRDRTGQRPSVCTIHPDIMLHGRLFRNQLTLSLDLSGDSLHKRGYRLQSTSASMKETLAAAVLIHAQWPQLASAGAPLIDPCCGAGTLLIEGALLAADSAPGLWRDYWGFTAWATHDPILWHQLIDEAQRRRTQGLSQLGPIIGYDLDSSAIQKAQANTEQAGLSDYIEFHALELSQCRPPERNQHGLLVTNPPYGERLGTHSEVTQSYTQLGQVMRDHFQGWQAAILFAQGSLLTHFGLQPTRRTPFLNGPIACELIQFRIPATTPTLHHQPPTPLPLAQRREAAIMLANRLIKNDRALARWRRQQQINCYRLYDADLPDYAVAIDIYTTCPQAHDDSITTVASVQEYAPPQHIDAALAHQRIGEVLGVLVDDLHIDAHHLFFKVRQRQRGKAQYQRFATTGRFYEVCEDGLRLQVNFEDYLDTGLFLHHRETRRLLSRQARGQRFLNLFGYTGVASCYAALGGAITTTTVDLSNTYTDWARRNLALNGFTAPAHQVLQADCLTWLNAQPTTLFDLIFLDPPTFSSSKRMSQTFDIQRDHVALIQAALHWLAPGGRLIFATNRRGFQLDDHALTACSIQDLTRATLPRDFVRRSRPTIHHCWQIQVERPA
jgi:23S rRNA (guanine2445-N2)-methyltransferase / 23S rRNA (guanine2069-N7)-methyltransferase